MQQFNGPATVANALFEEVKLFQADVPLIVALASPALRHRHWIDIAKKCGSDDFIVDEETTMSTLIEKGARSKIIIVRIIFICSFLFDFLFLNYTFQTNPNSVY